MNYISEIILYIITLFPFYYTEYPRFSSYGTFLKGRRRCEPLLAFHGWTPCASSGLVRKARPPVRLSQKSERMALMRIP